MSLKKYANLESTKLFLSFAEDSPFFRGHFENFPILAGVVQLHYVIHFIKTCFCEDIHIKSFRNIKFMKIISPRQKVVLKLTKHVNCRFSFSFETETGEPCSRGEILSDCSNACTY